MSTLYEIVENSDGEIILRRAGEEGSPLVSISFSEEALYFLNHSKLEVAKAMIEAGLEAASEEVDDEELSESAEPAIVH